VPQEAAARLRVGCSLRGPGMQVSMHLKHLPLRRHRASKQAPQLRDRRMRGGPTGSGGLHAL